MCYLRAKPTATQKEQKEQNIWQLDICNLSDDNLTKYYNIMINKKCTALIAYPSTLETAVTFWSKKFHNTSHIKTIISTSETLTSETRKKLKDFFGEKCTIFARYSNTENGILGQEYLDEGQYKLNWASYFFEILKLESDESAGEGELGRIIVTDLYNKAFPMIRYDTGDVAIMVKTKDGFSYLSQLYGRRMDLIYDTHNEVVSPFLLCRTMRLSHGIEQWQFIQNSKTEYILRITVTHGEKPLCEKEICSFKQVLGQDAVITIEYVDNIPVMNSMKRKLIVSILKK
jgi:phenylacetate-CoA ligase